MTPVKREIKAQDVDQLLSGYSLGTLKAFAAMKAKIASTIFHLHTDMGNYVLTLYEHDPLQDIDFLVTLKKHFSSQGIPCASPIADKQGNYVQQIADHNAVISAYLPGHKIYLTNAEQIKSIGQALGLLHTLGADFPEQRENQWGSSWRGQSVEPLLESLSMEDALLLQEELGYASRQDFNALPKGIIHGNLSLDNLLFQQNDVTGVVDFYYACYDSLLLDLAVTANACCQDGNCQLDQIMVDLLLASYQQHRTLTPLEHRAWPAIRQVAALRSWLLSLEHYYYPPKTKLTPPQNPNEAKIILEQLRDYNNIIKAQ